MIFRGDRGLSQAQPVFLSLSILKENNDNNC